MRRILVMDDEEAVRMLFAEELTDEGFEVLTSNDYNSFLDTVDQYMPELLIFDVRPGNLEDLYLLGDLRDAGHTFPIIMCSSYPVFYNYIQSKDIDYYIIKSANLSELKYKVKKAFEGGPKENRSDYLRIHGKVSSQTSLEYAV